MENIFLLKAKENIKASEILLKDGLYNASANRAYYAAFQAAVSVLEKYGLIIVKGLNHGAVQANFAGHLIQKQKLFSSHLKSYLLDLQAVRNDADYKFKTISKKIASRQVKKAIEFVNILEERIIQ